MILHSQASSLWRRLRPINSLPTNHHIIHHKPFRNDIECTLFPAFGTALFLQGWAWGKKSVLSLLLQPDFGCLEGLGKLSKTGPCGWNLAKFTQPSPISFGPLDDQILDA